MYTYLVLTLLHTTIFVSLWRSPRYQTGWGGFRVRHNISCFIAVCSSTTRTCCFSWIR